MSEKYRCLKCEGSKFLTSSTVWQCVDCHFKYPCVHGMPKLYLDEAIGLQDRKLRDKFYDGVFGIFYQFLMPFIVLPVRPFLGAIRHWALYLGTFSGIVLLALLGLWALIHDHFLSAGFAFLPVAGFAWFLSRQRYLFDLFLLAVPTKISLAFRAFKPGETFAEVHKRAIASLQGRNDRLKILDCSTGSCNSLYKHGWMSLDAEYTAIDLSETMLAKGQELMAARSIPVDLVLGNALDLPFQSESFDVVLNYGAINGMTDPARALAEMSRVAKPGALLLFLDEQMYQNASWIERLYFYKVLSSHNVIHHCPVELMPAALEDVRVSQVYEFYYICTARKSFA